MANCLQFNKEVKLNPGNSGTNKTRAMVCELLAIKLLKEYTTRELIDALAYDFDPLQGLTPPTSSSTLRGPGWDSSQPVKRPARAVRISCLEVAIRAQAKRFLAHPLVVQQLEAIWAGTVVFHSVADNLHRQPAARDRNSGRCCGVFNVVSSKGSDVRSRNLRRSVTLYNPRDASLFKLSRLRVPRYRHVLSTCSFAVLLGLYLAVIQERSLQITSLEVVFWFWSAGFMLDEILGFNEQGFSLYLMSFWNTFDLGILLLLVCYYCLRLYGVAMPEARTQDIASVAFDVLAANAVLLLPRLFSVLDHYRYFSQLLIAFRMMAVDLVAIFTLIVIACSGFFVAFTFCFGDGDSPSSVAYELFQLLMGFTPTAWQLWDRYNPLGKAVLTLFLFISHFLVMTILITVLTNSFMAIVQNANEEHQFVFAVNTISMVKSDALFSYVAPTNILAWIISPLRYVMPFRRFIQLNRTVIKITHFPILFTIYLYERTILRSDVLESAKFAEASGQIGFARTERPSRFDAFSPANHRGVREPSVATYQKDLALDEVFRQPFKDTMYRGTQKRNDWRRQTSTAVNNWMQDIGTENAAIPPEEQDRETVERLEGRRFRGGMPRMRRRNQTLHPLAETTLSPVSDPKEFLDNDLLRRSFHDTSFAISSLRDRQSSQQTDIDGDDELTSGDNNEDGDSARDQPSIFSRFSRDNEEGRLSSADNRGPATPRLKPPVLPAAKIISPKNSPSRRPKIPQLGHARNLSSATILYNPLPTQSPKKSDNLHNQPGRPFPRTPQLGGRPVNPNLSGREALRESTSRLVDPRPTMPSGADFLSVPDLTGFLWLDEGVRERRRSSLVLGLGSDLGDNNAIGGAFVGAVPSSFATQMAYATGGLRRPAADSNGNQEMLGKLMLARMKTLEEGFREVIKEVKDLRREERSQSHTRTDYFQKVNRDKKRKRERKRRVKEFGKSTVDSDADSPPYGKAQIADSPPELKGSSV
jgi:hypothetical protein